MRCLACNKNLTDREASRKYINWREIKNTEDRYPMLCNGCYSSTGMVGWEDPSSSDEEFQDEVEVQEEDDDPDL